MAANGNVLSEAGKHPKIVTAAMLAIGDELLSGRTKDRNIAWLADFLTLHGIELKEARIVADEEPAIIEAVNALRKLYDLVFTSGGIGPTHDDITADAIAAAFQVPVSHDPRAMKILGDFFDRTGIEFTTARKRMARIPHGASLIENPVSIAPGFILENVHVMAGVPAIFQAMMGCLSSGLERGDKIVSQMVVCPFGEGSIGDRLGEIQAENPETSIGSYPQYDGKNYSTQIVVRGRKQVAIEIAITAIKVMLKELKGAAGQS